MNILGPHRKTEKTFVIFYFVSAVALVLVMAPIFNTLLAHTPAELSETARQPIVYNAITLSIYAAFTSSMVTLLLGVPLTYVLDRKTFPGKSVVESVVDRLLVVPHTVAAIKQIMERQEVATRTHSSLQRDT